jgi:p21-activated kinase 5
MVDPSEITPTEILDLKTIVRGDHKVNESRLSQSNVSVVSQPTQNPQNGLILPKNSHVARSNSLRSSSPPRVRRDYRQPNVPPSVPEETQQPPTGPQYPSLRREPQYPPKGPRESPAEWSVNQHSHHHDNANSYHPHPQELLHHYQDNMLRNSPSIHSQQDTTDNGSGQLRPSVSQQMISYQNANIHPPVGYHNPMHGSNSSGLNGNLMSPCKFRFINRTLV